MPIRAVAKNFEWPSKSIFLDFSQQTGAFPGSTHGYAVVQGVDGAPLAVPVQACGVTVQTQPFYGYPQAGQTNIGGPVPFQAVANQPTGFPPQYTEKSQHVPPPEQIWMGKLL